jgi:hypothetical protein
MQGDSEDADAPAGGTGACFGVAELVFGVS